MVYTAAALRPSCSRICMMTDHCDAEVDGGPESKLPEATLRQNFNSAALAPNQVRSVKVIGERLIELGSAQSS
jgi:hypothetical protein